MQSNIAKNIEKIFTSFDSLHSLTKTVIKRGTHIFFALFFLGVLLVAYNHVRIGYNAYFEFLALSVIKSSFTILAEIVIGCLLIDYLHKKA